MSGAARFLPSVLQVSQSVTLYHYLLRSSKKRLPTYEDANQAPYKTPRSKNNSKANKVTALLQPEETLSLKYIIRIKDEGNIMNPCIPVMNVIRNTKGSALCLTFLIGGHCDSTDPCGYHLQVNDQNRLIGTSNTDYVPFHDWLAASK